jgi:hypothetical protein
METSLEHGFGSGSQSPGKAGEESLNCTPALRNRESEIFTNATQRTPLRNCAISILKDL